MLKTCDFAHHGLREKWSFNGGDSPSVGLVAFEGIAKGKNALRCADLATMPVSRLDATVNTAALAARTC